MSGFMSFTEGSLAISSCRSVFASAIMERTYEMMRLRCNHYVQNTSNPACQESRDGFGVFRSKLFIGQADVSDFEWAHRLERQFLNLKLASFNPEQTRMSVCAVFECFNAKNDVPYFFTASPSHSAVRTDEPG